VYTLDVPIDPDAARIERNRKRNASLVQTRVPLPIRLKLSTAARRRGVSVSALVSSILIEWSSISVARTTRRA
jgi:hypothetical protein